jgi:hypothetical protein
MEEEKIVIEMTPFIFEDGNTYYFQVVKRARSNDYHDIFVYEKIKLTNKIKSFWGKITSTEFDKFQKVSDRPELISVNLDTNEIKKEIKKILIATKAKHQLKNWDGFVGNIPDDVKLALKRENSLKNILGE